MSLFSVFNISGSAMNAETIRLNTTASNAVQTIAIQKAASGTFTLSYNGQTSGAITYSTTPATTASAILTALTSSPIPELSM